MLSIKILKAAYPLLLFRRIISSVLRLWAKNTARGVRFLLAFNMYLFWAHCEQVYLFLARALTLLYTRYKAH